MPPDPEQPPQYTRYRASRRLLPRREEDAPLSGPIARPRGQPAGARRGGLAPAPGWRRALTRKRIVLGVLGLALGWVLLSLLLFLVSSHFERTSPPADVAGVLDGAGFPLTSANNIVVLGSDRREKNSREPGAKRSGPSRSDTIMLIRTGGGHAARLSIPRDTVVE